MHHACLCIYLYMFMGVLCVVYISNVWQRWADMTHHHLGLVLRWKHMLSKHLLMMAGGALLCHTFGIYIYSIYMALYPFVTSRCQNVQPYNISTSVEWQRKMWMWWFSLGCCVRFSMIGVKMHTVWRNSVFEYYILL